MCHCPTSNPETLNPKCAPSTNQAPSNVNNITAVLFLWTILPGYAAASYMPTIVLERPLYVRCALGGSPRADPRWQQGAADGCCRHPCVPVPASHAQQQHPRVRRRCPGPMLRPGVQREQGDARGWRCPCRPRGQEGGCQRGVTLQAG